MIIFVCGGTLGISATATQATQATYATQQTHSAQHPFNLQHAQHTATAAS